MGDEEEVVKYYLNLFFDENLALEEGIESEHGTVKVSRLYASSEEALEGVVQHLAEEEDEYVNTIVVPMAVTRQERLH